MKNLALRIALRYFFSRKKKHFINIISIISLVVVMVGTMALVLVLSVFNGLEEVVRELHHTFHPDLQITPAKGKTFLPSPKQLAQIKNLPGVAHLSEVIEDNALLRYRDRQMVVKLKGISENFAQHSRLDTALVAGSFALREGNHALAVIGRGVQMTLSISLQNRIDGLQCWYPKRTDEVNLSSINPDKSFNRKSLRAGGVFSLEKAYDERYIFVPLDFMAKLTEYHKRRTSLEIQVSPLSQLSEIQAQIREIMGAGFLVKNSDEQQASLLRAIKIEKFFVYLTLSFILAVASFNIFFALMMLVIDKKKDIGVLMAMGASESLIRKIFMWEGVIIAFGGAGIGLLLGAGIALLQQEYGLISMGTTMTIIQAYPVKLLLSDFVYTGLTIVLITLLASFVPARTAARIEVKAHLG
ncbi:MAG: lipoprotein-releasing ABC transporter permease subunit [Microscillaceae bacterium]